MKPEELVKELTRPPMQGIRSIILFGSAAAGDHWGAASDFNVLVVTEHLGLAELRAITKPTLKWIKSGNPPPLLFTIDRLEKSCDVFPIELLDMRDSHQVLYGKDVVEDLVISSENLRLQLESELKGKLIQLRERFLVTGGKRKQILRLMIESLSAFLVLFRAALRLFSDSVPKQKLAALDELGKFLSFDPEVFQTVEKLKRGRLKPRSLDAERVFAEYLSTIESIVDAVDSYVRSPESVS